MDQERIFHIAGIISKYVHGDLTLQEQEELENWKSQSPEHSRLFEEFSRYEFLERKQVAERLCARERAWQQFCERRRVTLRRKKVRMYWIRSVAAVLLIGVTVLMFYRRSESPETSFIAQSLTAGESRAILTLADGQKINLGKQSADTLLEKDGALLNTSANCIAYNPLTGDRTEIMYNCLDVPRKGEYMLVLSDGSKVWLNSESQLRYPASFQGKERRVFLKGEAYFEVCRNEEMPFIVVTGKSAVQVLGTSFNIRAYTDEKYSYTTLVDGSVRVSAGTQSMVLEPAEQGRVSVSGSLDKRKVDVNLYTAWKKGRFVFENQTLEEMMNTLSRWYDVNVFFTTERVKEAMFTGNLKRYDDFDKIVEMLELTGVAHFKIDGNAVVISE